MATELIIISSLDVEIGNLADCISAENVVSIYDDPKDLQIRDEEGVSIISISEICDSEEMRNEYMDDDQIPTEFKANLEQYRFFGVDCDYGKEKILYKILRLLVSRAMIAWIDSNDGRVLTGYDFMSRYSIWKGK